MFTFKRKANYYETDQMGIVHHSNYIRWFEEARVAFLDEVGLPLRELEENGVVIPVLRVECAYKSPVRFDETLELRLSIEEYNGFRFKVRYVGVDLDTGRVSVEGESEHCFTSRDMRPVRLKNRFPKWHALFMDLSEER